MGVGYRMEFDSIITEDMTTKQCVYIFFLENQILILSTVDIGDGEKLKLREIAEYMVNNLTIEK